MQRACDQCGEPYEAKRSTSKYHSAACRVAANRGTPPAELANPKGQTPASTDVADALLKELTLLGLADSYEAAIAIKTARQLDNGTIVGTAFTSLSKELDRRVDALRLKAERPDDPAREIRERFEEKRLRLVTDEVSSRQVR